MTFNYYLSKKDLHDNYSDDDLKILATHFNIDNNGTREDLCWLLAIQISKSVKTHKKGTMFKAPAPVSKPRSLIHERFKPLPKKQMGNLLWQSKFNLSDDQCEWPTRLSGRPVVKCGFNAQPYKHNKDINLVTVPAGTTLYRGVKDVNTEYNDFKSLLSVPRDLIWFASTEEHAMPLGPLAVHKMTTKEPLLLVFSRNLSKEFKVDTGFDMIVPLKLIAKQLKNDNIEIDGYMGCNECEYGLFANETTLSKLDYPSEKKLVPLTYID